MTAVQQLSKRIIGAMIIISAIIPQISNAQWTKVEAPQLAGVFVYDIDFPTATTGYAIGSTSQSIVIYKTTDAGATWNKTKPIGLIPYGLVFLDENTGMAGGWAPGCMCQSISRTTDGGKTWKLDSLRKSDGKIDQVQSSFGIYAFSFVNNLTGYAAGANGMMLKTTNGGAKWERLNTGVPNDLFADVSFSTPEHGIAVAAPGNDLNSPTIFYRTTDGGATWERKPDFVPGAAFGRVLSVTPEVGFLVGTDGQGIVYKTSDGGTTWSRKFAQGGASDVMYGLEFENPSLGYAIGTNGAIARTVDGGESWTMEQTGTTEVLQAISIINGTVYASGTAGTIVRRLAGASGLPSGDEETGDASVLLLPNPVTSSATLSHPGLRAGGHLALFDLLGREVRRITAPPGTETLRITRDGLPAGTYVYRMVAGSDILATGTMVVQ